MLSVAKLCRREGIHPTVYYHWPKDLMEAGKARMRGTRCGGPRRARCDT